MNHTLWHPLTIKVSHLFNVDIVLVIEMGGLGRGGGGERERERERGGGGAATVVM